MTTKTAVLYARYSSDKQREASIDDQLRVCRDYCAREGIEVLKAYTDYALSGKTDQRPEFRRMIAAAPESDYVVVYMFDRFSRDRYDSATYKKMLRDLGVRVLSASEKVEDTPEGGLQEGLLEILSEYYVADLRRKVRRGMEGNALKAMNNGYKLFGYDTDPATRRYIVNEAEADVVREVFSRYLEGETMYAIALSLAARGWTTATGTPVDYNWVSRVLGRRAYTGLYSWGGIEVEGGMPVIVDSDTFERARKAPRKKPRDIEVWSSFPLSGKLICGCCGEPMHGSGGTGKSGKRYYYYMCKEKGDCRRRVRRELVEDTLADAVLRIASDESLMRMVARRIVEAYEDGSDARAELESVERRISSLEREQHNLTAAAAKGFVNDETVARNEEIKVQLRDLHDRHGILMSETAGFTEDEIVEFFAHGFDRSDEGFIFGSFVSRVHLFSDCMVAVFSFRDELGDLYEERLALDEGMKKENPVGFSLTRSGVPGVDSQEPWIIALTCGFGLVIPLAA